MAFQFKYDVDYYTVQGASSLTEKQLRAEYTRMRDVAQKRIDRLSENYQWTKAFQQHSHGFPKLKELDKRDLTKAFADLAKFVGSKGSTVSGQKSIERKTIQTWKKQGLDLNPGNYQMSIRILEELRKRKMIYGSDKVVSLAESMMQLSPTQVNTWLDHLDQLLPHAEELQEIPDVAGYDFDEVIAMLGD